MSTLPADIANKTIDNQKPDNSFKKRSTLRRKGSGDALKPKREQEFKSIEKHKQTDQSKSASPFETKFKSRTAYSNPYLNLGKKAGSGLKKTKRSTPVEPDSIDFAGALEQVKEPQIINQLTYDEPKPEENKETEDLDNTSVEMQQTELETDGSQVRRISVINSLKKQSQRKQYQAITDKLNMQNQQILTKFKNYHEAAKANEN